MNSHQDTQTHLLTRLLMVQALGITPKVSIAEYKELQNCPTDMTKLKSLKIEQDPYQ